MASVFLVPRDKWPFLICGPMLRRVTPDQVAVFVAASLPFEEILKILVVSGLLRLKTSRSLIITEILEIPFVSLLDTPSP
jgi:aspartokinase-like uncharacterized kinase